jgi:hypothetical protein
MARRLVAADLITLVTGSAVDPLSGAGRLIATGRDTTAGCYPTST